MRSCANTCLMNFDLNDSLLLALQSSDDQLTALCREFLNFNQFNARFAPERGEEYAEIKSMDLQHKLLGFKVSFQSF